MRGPSHPQTARRRHSAGACGRSCWRRSSPWSYQLWNGELCASRNRLDVCVGVLSQGPRAYLLAAPSLYRIGVMTLREPWSRRFQKPFWILAGGRRESGGDWRLVMARAAYMRSRRSIPRPRPSSSRPRRRCMAARRLPLAMWYSSSRARTKTGEAFSVVAWSPPLAPSRERLASRDNAREHCGQTHCSSHARLAGTSSNAFSPTGTTTTAWRQS